ncbi:DUF288 domain-containing protein [Patescibacteria group bacterium]|nr:DUF288 domain-containing protein [Patescibacteria group bacterium]MBU2259425.1 DUF288 domain-containing protein [Patescibacteria group bacterium]
MHGVITTIQQPTASVKSFASAIGKEGGEFIIMGDRKGPDVYDIPNTRLIPLSEQSESGFALANNLPTDHYVRKNLGYLTAMKEGADCIFETDDDNAPKEGWAMRSSDASVQKVTPRPWCNVFKLFTNEHIWPRGFPLEHITDLSTHEHNESAKEEIVHAPIQQGIVDNNPDVDALWRLVYNHPLNFEDKPSVMLPPETWCPFNSQCTWWWPEAYPLMYLPSYCTFRMTDIWRSFIAQRCLWAMGYGMVFHASEVVQERNVHNLIKDFQDEIPGYTGNLRITEILQNLSLEEGNEHTGENLRKCYEALIENEFFQEKELYLADAWLSDIRNCFC